MILDNLKVWPEGQRLPPALLVFFVQRTRGPLLPKLVTLENYLGDDTWRTSRGLLHLSDLKMSLDSREVAAFIELPTAAVRDPGGHLQLRQVFGGWELVGPHTAIFGTFHVLEATWKVSRMTRFSCKKSKQPSAPLAGV